MLSAPLNRGCVVSRAVSRGVACELVLVLLWAAGSLRSVSVGECVCCRKLVLEPAPDWDRLID